MLREDEGTPTMKEIAAHVRKGAMAYLKQQYKVVTIVFIILAVFFAVLAYGFDVQNHWVPFAFLTGGFFSGLAGFIGMKTATYASGRTANAARRSLNSGLKLAFRSGAVMGLTVRPNLVLVDGNRVPHIDIAVNAIVGGDDKVAAISAASIIAKTTRDQWLIELDKEHPEYGFAKHKGYGTAEHLAALEKYGPLPAHRKTFGPVRKVIEMRKGKEGELELS